MVFYPNAVRSECVREYLPCVRVLWSDRAENADGTLPGNVAVQPLLEEFGALVTIGNGGGILLDFGIELNGGVRIVGSARPGVVRLRFGESAGEAMNAPDQDHAIHDEILHVPAMGVLEYGNTGFRFVRIDATGGDVRLRNVLAVALFRDLPRTGSFRCSDSRVERIWSTAVYTVQLNLQEYIYDGIKRDRLVWAGDLNVELRTVLAAFGALPIIPETLDFAVRNSPDIRKLGGIPSYSLWWVVALYEYFFRSGDFAFLEREEEVLRELLDYAVSLVGEDGAERIGEMRFLDWRNHADPAAVHAGLQGLLCLTLKCGEELCGFLGIDSGKIAAVRGRMALHRPDCGESKAAAALLTLSGIDDRSHVLLADPFRGIGTFSGFHILFALPTGNALELIRRYWGAMLDYGATTFWEEFDLDWIRNASGIAELPRPDKADLHADFGSYCFKGLRHSLCHGWAAGPAPFLSERVLGIRFLEPGGRRIAVCPDLGGLEYVSGVYPTPCGPVTVEAEASGRVRIGADSRIEIVEARSGMSCSRT